MRDIGAIVWKEWRELVGQRGLRGKQGIVLFIAVFGVVLPWQTGPQWVTSPMVAIAWSWVPMFLVTTVIADAFAGERERHTLETLLATRLSDSAILFGKIGAAIGYAALLTVVCLVLGVVVVNVADTRNGLVLYSLPVALAIAVIGLLGALFVAAMGILVSLRSATVRQAQQMLGAAIMVLLFAPLGFARLMPDTWKQSVLSNAAGMAQLAIVGIAVLAALDALLLAFAMMRFRRNRLM